MSWLEARNLLRSQFAGRISSLFYLSALLCDAVDLWASWLTHVEYSSVQCHGMYC